MKKGYGKHRVPYFIFRLQRIWKRTCQINYWMIVVSYRYCFGRWFIFRGAPDWFVWLLAVRVDIDDDDLIRVCNSAIDEKQTRIQSRLRWK